MTRLLMCVLLMFLLTGCSRSGPDSAFSDRLAKAVSGPEGTKVRIADVVPEEWSRFCVFPPYSDKERIESALGFGWENSEGTGIDAAEGRVLLVVVDGEKVVKWTMHPRPKGDFSELEEPYCHERDEAVFVTGRNSSGWISLKHAS